MDHSLEVTNIKTKSTPSDRLDIPSEQMERVKPENDYLVKSEFHIKIEPQENENTFSVITGTYDMCLNDDIKIEPHEPLIKIECENIIDEDPLDVGSEIKVEEHFLIKLEGEMSKKTERIEVEEDDPHRSESDCQDQMFVKYTQVKHKNIKYTCDVCHKIFTWKSQLDIHLRIHTGAKPYTCKICEKSFVQIGDMNRHMLIHSGEKLHVCDLCKKGFNKKANLNKHKLIHSGVKPFSCDVCDKSFTRKHHLAIHSSIHSGDKPYACGICDKTFVQKSDLTKHTRTHTGEKPYSCDVCTKSFTLKSNLSTHRKLHKN